MFINFHYNCGLVKLVHILLCMYFRLCYQVHKVYHNYILLQWIISLLLIFCALSSIISAVNLPTLAFSGLIFIKLIFFHLSFSNFLHQFYFRYVIISPLQRDHTNQPTNKLGWIICLLKVKLVFFFLLNSLSIWQSSYFLPFLSSFVLIDLCFLKQYLFLSSMLFLVFQQLSLDVVIQVKKGLEPGIYTVLYPFFKKN